MPSPTLLQANFQNAEMPKVLRQVRCLSQVRYLPHEHAYTPASVLLATCSSLLLAPLVPSTCCAAAHSCGAIDLRQPTQICHTLTPLPQPLPLCQMWGCAMSIKPQAACGHFCNHPRVLMTWPAARGVCGGVKLSSSNTWQAPVHAQAVRGVASSILSVLIPHSPAACFLPPSQSPHPQYPPRCRSTPTRGSQGT